MMATRRVTRRSASMAECPATEQIAVVESPSVRITRSRIKMNSHTQVISESQNAEMKASEAKLDAEKSSEACPVLSKDKAEPLAESQVDGDVSEAESTCSSVSGLQTPLFIRITRRRKIVIPCSPETSAKNRPSKKNVTHESGNCEDHDISEAESCSSVVSGTRTSKTMRKSRCRQVKGNVSPVCEVQDEEVSDAESWCSGVSYERSGPFKRVTRSMRLKLQAESTSQTERKSNALGEDTETPDCIITSETIVISDSEESTVSDFNAKESPCLSSNWIKEHLSPNKTKCLPESVASNDLDQIFSSSNEEVTREDNKNLPKQVILKNNDDELEHSVSKETAADIIAIVQSPDEMHDQSSEKPMQVSENHLPSENSKRSPCDPENLEKSNESSGKATVNKNKSLTPENVRQSCLHKREEIIDSDDISKVGSPTNKTITSLIVNSNDCRPSVSSVDSDGNLEEVIAESSSCATKGREDKKDLFVSLTSEESENNNLEKLENSEIGTGYDEGSSESPLRENQSNNQEMFVIDKTPGIDSHKDYYFEEKQSEDSSEVEESEEEFIDEDEDELNANTGLVSFSSSIDPGLNIKQFGGLYINFDSGKQKPGSHNIPPLKEKKTDELLQKSIITPDFEKKECVPPLRESIHQLKKQRRKDRAKTTGDGWFGMKAPEITEELKNDLKALQMRAAIDPKRFYKKNDRKGLPKYFQVGTIMDSPADFYHARIPKKERKKTIVDELLADSEFRRYNKRKYQDIIAEKEALAAGKKNRKKKKFHK
ncbi:deoxynucleotidyltransferase terminal-interacting protein 2 isoform X1 [Notechis scutatus]|uniref:Deoxynucleotidyltransferase terminal-interacting protein 2 isoform X1 n=1 Tax=Notechis scutatus TaxID=8663 RepID=A0A6J1UIB1_9SAUR|nr:deoxynucleotidyltransferase terminal-interacting protein 2 isoform X1 [Notechis scutatus]